MLLIKEMQQCFHELSKPKDPNYRYFILFNDHKNRFQYYEITGISYSIPNNFPTVLGYLPKFVPKILERPLLYYQNLPKFF